MNSHTYIGIDIKIDEKLEEANEVFKNTVSDNTQSLSRLDDANNQKQTNGTYHVYRWLFRINVSHHIWMYSIF